mmetsp:Transcript_18269/g.60019  ORF Transcript_18269/g.60019 Transcript_18269/m.60019 type:complete len:271 (-) Transcript_18269:273-1085(-)
MPSTALCGLKLILSPILLLLCVVVAQPAVASNVTCPQFEVASSQLYRTTSVGCTLTVDLNFHVKPGLSLDTNSVKLTHDVVMGVSLPSLQSTQFASSPPKTEAFTNMIYYVSRVVWTPELVHSAQTYLLNVFVPTCDTSSLLRVTVNKCKMCLSEDQTLESIAGLYNRHWSQIWSVNPFLLSPDKISAVGLKGVGVGDDDGYAGAGDQSRDHLLDDGWRHPHAPLRFFSRRGCRMCLLLLFLSSIWNLAGPAQTAQSRNPSECVSESWIK